MQEIPKISKKLLEQLFHRITPDDFTSLNRFPDIGLVIKWLYSKTPISHLL